MGLFGEHRALEATRLRLLERIETDCYRHLGLESAPKIDEAEVLGSLSSQHQEKDQG